MLGVKDFLFYFIYSGSIRDLIGVGPIAVKAKAIKISCV